MADQSTTAPQRRLQVLLGHVSASNSSQAGLGLAACAGKRGPWSKLGEKGEGDVVIVSALRTAIGKARKGCFKDTTPDILLTKILKGTMDRLRLDPREIEDIAIGNVQMGGAYAGPARMAQLIAGFPETTPLYSLNRQCSSGLQAVANVAESIMSGRIDAGIGCGVESMTNGGGVKDAKMPPIDLNAVFECELARQCLTPMGITSENVASRYGITRAQQDAMAVVSHAKALKAQATGLFSDEILPIQVTWEDKEGEEQEITVTKDDGPRPGTTVAGLAKLRAVFKKGGSTTAGNASQVSDGAAAVVLMRRSKAVELGMPILGAMRGFQVVGVKPDEMGVGPAVAIPAICEMTGIKVSDVDIFELNEAFASQAVYCVQKLGIPMEKVNPLGGAIALGHPLGCTGARCVATVLHQLRRTKKRFGVVSMCIGTGMGAAALFEAE